MVCPSLRCTLRCYLGTWLRSCFSVSMSVNRTARPPPLVFSTSPYEHKDFRASTRCKHERFCFINTNLGLDDSNKRNTVFYRPYTAVALMHTLKSLVLISPSEATSWWVSTYLWHLDRSFSLGERTLMALGMLGCRTVPRSRLEDGV